LVLCFVEDFTRNLLACRSKHRLLERRLTSETCERTTQSPKAGTASGGASQSASASDGDGLKDVGDLLTEVGNEPLDSITARLDVSEPPRERRRPAQVFDLLFDDTTAKLFGTEKLKPATKQKLHRVNAATEALGEESAEAGVLDTTEVSSVALRIDRGPPTTLRQRYTRLA
jgi:hypothetical protein